MTNQKSVENASANPTTALAIKNQVENFFLTTPGKVVFRERFWNIWNDDEVLTDIGSDHENYGIMPLVQLSNQVDEKISIIFSDTAVDYCSNGRRIVKAAPFVAVINTDKVFWQKKKELEEVCRRVSTLGHYLVDTRKMRKVFREKVDFFDKLEKKYPGVKWRFNVSDDHESFSIAMNLEGQTCARRFSTLRDWDIAKLPYSTLTGLRKRFEAFSIMLSKGASESIDANETINTMEVSFNDQIETVKTYVGYAGIPFDVAEKSVKDIRKLKDLWLNGAETFNITLDGNIISNTCNEFKFNEDFGCCTDKVLLLAPEVYMAWGQPWTEKELVFFNRERKFPYFNPDLEEEERKKRVVSFITLPILSALFGLGDWAIFKTGLWEANNELSVVLLAVSAVCLITAVIMIIRLIGKKH